VSEARRRAAIARGRAYDLLGGLFRRGPARLDHLRAVEVLAPHVPDAIDDEVLAEHFGLFGRNLPPYEGVFRDPRALLGGDISAAARRAMAAGGFTPDDTDAEADHVGTELGYLAHLCAAEADAWRDGLPGVAARVSGLQQDFLTLHLMRWLPPFVVAVEDAGRPLYTEAARLTLALAADHLTGEPLAVDLPPVADLLADARTGIRQIGDFLAVPANAGALCAPAQIQAIGRTVDVPAGLGKRGMMFENLLQSAIRSERLPALLHALDGWYAAREARLAALPGGGPWARRVAETRGMLRRIEEAAKQNA
jgi:TorA maturation chaperone TorD